MKLSPRMERALNLLSRGANSAWTVGWGTYNALLRRGLVAPTVGVDRVRITPKGRRALHGKDTFQPKEKT